MKLPTLITALVLGGHHGDPNTECPIYHPPHSIPLVYDSCPNGIRLVGSNGYSECAEVTVPEPPRFVDKPAHRLGGAYRPTTVDRFYFETSDGKRCHFELGDKVPPMTFRDWARLHYWDHSERAKAANDELVRRICGYAKRRGQR